jgi:vacuolar-type H+-ATPase subunit C/Vma6
MSGYEYGNTRLRAMRSRLLTRSDLLDLAAAGTLDRMLARLADTAYAADVEAALLRGRGISRLDRAVRSHLGGTLRRMASFYDGRPRQMVDLLLARWDLTNLEILIRLAHASSVTVDPSAVLVPAGRIGAAQLAEMAAQRDVRSLVDLMIAWDIPSEQSSLQLLRARSDYVTNGDITAIEVAVASVFANHLIDTLKERSDKAAEVLRAELDARNLEIALRLRAARLAGEQVLTVPERRYLPGGLGPVEIWGLIAETDDPRAVVDLASRHGPVQGWEEAVSAWAESGSSIELRDRLQRAVTTVATSLFVSGDPLDFDIPVAFTFAKEAEARNLHLVGRGIVHQLSPAALEERLEVAA